MNDGSSADDGARLFTARPIGAYRSMLAGHIAVRSTPGQGSCSTVWQPAAVSA